MKELKSYRMSQGLTTFGIGSIIGIGDESFINTGVTNEDDQNSISFPRLARRLKVSTLRYPKVKYLPLQIVILSGRKMLLSES